MGYYGSPYYDPYGSACCPPVTTPCPPIAPYPTPVPARGGGAGYGFIIVVVILLLILGAMWYHHQQPRV
ncbi:hypothetical protein [Bacillus alkalicellulosilyticus]|uniref:hypothetical protein n=1 Tax=Alkalihalobacterium alkalicellulosilyticum TaxID=1912214 RepID=UPI000997BF93|nr:hypothetical protein [Bacillus alkalicellulosilyticus]